ncbi:DNA-binding response regulator [Dyadobacter sediminis]|nr:DNA-binding response regulator [Dyadobacter sediminis]
MTEILIIENESKIAQELKDMIELTNAEFKVCGILQSVFEAKIWLINNKTPQLIFCSIQLPDGLGFEIFQDLSIAAPVIFCTDYNEYALEAFENNGIDYLLKPLDHFKLQRSLKKFTQLKELFGEENALNNRKFNNAALYLNSYKSSLLVYYQDKIIPVSLDKVDFIYYNNYQVNVYMQNAHYETRDTLNNIITSLNPKDFFRANRQFIIHRKAVVNIQQYFGRKLLIGTSSPTPEPVVVSKANSSEFLKWVEGLNTEENAYSALFDNMRLMS